MGLSIDREKVVKGLEKCQRHECDDCTEKGASQAPWDCPAYDDFVDSAIALLKEQEAVSVVQREVAHLLVWCCGSCGVAITHGDKFCRNCGKVMKWND